KCQKPLIRKEWRQLTTTEKKQFITSMKCMATRPSKAPKNLAPGARHRYDDFNSVHIIMSDGLPQKTGGIHLVGFFFPWHRYFLSLFETALRTECGWTFGLPYWDWSQDAISNLPLKKWPVYDPVTGFGGNGPLLTPPQNATYSWPYLTGQTGGGCVENGPFQNWTINVGPGQSTALNTRCLKRGLNPDTVQWLRPERVGRAMLAENFTEFDARAQAPPDVTPETTIRMMHAAGHYVTGGEATDYISSTSEPLFWLHHAYLDKVYSSWQAMKPAKRLSDIGGPSLPLSPESPQVTLNTTLDVLWEGEKIPLSKVMDISGNEHDGFLCYRY
ncbi:hypothetical protein FPQ18DRAFT_241486, partial [Pyronema domesticum]